MSLSRALPFAVIGATGQQGSAVIDSLLDRGEPVRALTRDPTSVKGLQLASRGVEVVSADIDDAGSLSAALGDVQALFMMTTYDGDRGVEGEIAHGQAIADAAVLARVPRVVYSSVGGAERSTGIPHFESKRQVELYLAARVPTSYVRPTFFMENLVRAIRSSADDRFVLRLPLPGSVPLQMIAVRDIGVVSAALLLDPARIAGDAVEIAGDVLTGDEIAAKIGERLGRPGRFEELPLRMLDDDPDRQAMFRWFGEPPSYQADFAATRAVDPGVLDLSAWLGTQVAR